MQIKFNQTVSLTPDEVKDIIVKYLHFNHNLSGIFDVSFVVKNKPIPSSVHPQDTIDRWIFDGAEIRISTNET